MKKTILIFTLFILTMSLVSAGWFGNIFKSPGDTCVDFDTSQIGYQFVQKFSASYAKKGTSILNDQCISYDSTKIREAYCYSLDVASWTTQDCGEGYRCMLDSNGRAYCGRTSGGNTGGTTTTTDSN